MGQTLGFNNGMGMGFAFVDSGNRALQKPPTRCAAVDAECAAGCRLRMATARSV